MSFDLMAIHKACTVFPWIWIYNSCHALYFILILIVNLHLSRLYLCDAPWPVSESQSVAWVYFSYAIIYTQDSIPVPVNSVPCNDDYSIPIPIPVWVSFGSLFGNIHVVSTTCNVHFIWYRASFCDQNILKIITKCTYVQLYTYHSSPYVAHCQLCVWWRVHFIILCWVKHTYRDEITELLRRKQWYVQWFSIRDSGKSQ